MLYNRDLLTVALTKVPGSWPVPQGPTLTFQVGREVGSTAMQDTVKGVQGMEYVREPISDRAPPVTVCSGVPSSLQGPEACQLVKWRKQAPRREHLLLFSMAEVGGLG